MVDWKKSFNQPAKLAERVLAPGDGEAEPGVIASNFREPAKLATDAGRKSAIENSKFKLFFVQLSSVAHFVGWDRVGLGPQARLRHRLGLALFPPASQAG